MDDPTTLKRPKPGDDEESLFRMQEEFLRSRQEPSAKVINLRAQARTVEPKQSTETNCTKAPGRTRSKFAERKARERGEKLSTSQSDGPMINPDVAKSFSTAESAEILSDSVQNIPLNPSSIILGRIVEKKYNANNYPSQFSNCPISDNKDKGFPDVFLIDNKVSGEAGSLFLQNLPKNAKQQISASKFSLQAKSSPEVVEENKRVEGSLMEEIHRDNVEKLKRMSQEEILAAKSQLESTLSPELIEFLKVKKKIKSSTTVSEQCPVNMEVDQSKEIKQDMKTEEKEYKAESGDDSMEVEAPVSELVETAAKKGWMHMDKIEQEKLEWMKDVVPEKLDEKACEQPYNARFDFNGVLLPFRDDDLTVDKGLHHHGEEPERPGYSLQELLQLSRSSSQQQRCTALTTLANIMEKSRKGWYDKALEPAPLVALSERNILLLLRFALDDTSTAVVTSTLQALRAFLYSEADEVCLDRLVSWPYPDGTILEPELPAPKTDVSDTNNLKDHELAQLDTVAAAIRSDILLRIRYILNEMHPPPVGVTAAIEILTRLARESRTTALNIACTPRLLDIIVQNFIPVDINRSSEVDETRNAYGVPSVSAVRLCRVLVAYAGRPVAERLNNLKILHSIISYTTQEANFIGIRLSIESLRLWKLLLSHNVALESISGARLAFLTQLQLLLSNHNLDGSSELSCEHAAALIEVSIYEQSLRTYVSTLLTKWSTQLEKMSSPTWSQTKLVAVTLTVLNDVSAFKCPSVADSNIFANLCSTSNLLSGYSSLIRRDPTSLPSLGVLIDAENALQPSVSLNSAFPFLASWFNAFCSSTRIFELGETLKNENFVKYVKRLASEDWSLENSWYTRPELFFVTGIVRTVMRLGDIVDESARRVVLKIAIKLVSTLPSDASATVKEILGYVLNDEALTIEKLSESLNSLKLNVVNERAKKLTNIPKDLSNIYGRYVSSIGTWNQAAMPKDWLYLPVVAAYTDCKNNIENWNDENTTKIIVQLSLELSMPEIVAGLSPSLRFSRLLLIYLCDTVYLNNDVSVLLNETLTRLLKRHYKKMDFTTELPGLTSFTDLFTSLCEAFCANSYGNDGFSMALIVPVCQRHDVHYRKLLWSEHAGTLRYIRLKREQLVVPLNEYLYPIEDDPTLIESYMTALVRGIVKSTWCPLMYEIALHHSAMYLRGNGKLAVSMRKKISNLRDTELSASLLNYEPPEMQ